MSGAQILLEAKRLEAWYGAAQILFGFDLHVNRGEVVALMGRNGAGKSTTLKTIMGMLDKRRGDIRFLGHDISKTEPPEAGVTGAPQPRGPMSNCSSCFPIWAKCRIAPAGG